MVFELEAPKPNFLLGKPHVLHGAGLGGGAQISPSRKAPYGKGLFGLFFPPPVRAPSGPRKGLHELRTSRICLESP